MDPGQPGGAGSKASSALGTAAKVGGEHPAATTSSSPGLNKRLLGGHWGILNQHTSKRGGELPSGTGRWGQHLGPLARCLPKPSCSTRARFPISISIPISPSLFPTHPQRRGSPWLGQPRSRQGAGGPPRPPRQRPANKDLALAGGSARPGGTQLPTHLPLARRGFPSPGDPGNPGTPPCTPCCSPGRGPLCLPKAVYRLRHLDGNTCIFTWLITKIKLQ